MFYMKIDFDAQCLKDIFISDALKGNFFLNCTICTHTALFLKNKNLKDYKTFLISYILCDSISCMLYHGTGSLPYAF